MITSDILRNINSNWTYISKFVLFRSSLNHAWESDTLAGAAT